MNNEDKVKFVNGDMVRYRIYKILDEYSQQIKDPVAKWDFESLKIEDLKYICTSMAHTMVENAGIGLAANQVGVPYRIFVMGAGNQVKTIVNPEILERSEDYVYDSAITEFTNGLDKKIEKGTEGCLSFPGLYLEVERSFRIKVKYFDMNGKEHNEIFEGLTARVFQHEFEHLDGICFTSRVSKFDLMKAKNKVKSNLKKLKRYKEERAAERKLMAKLNTLQQVKAAAAEAEAKANAQVYKSNTEVFKIDTGNILKF